MTSPFRSEVGPLNERVRRIEEANAAIADGIGELENEVTLRGPSRGRVRAVMWSVAALAMLGLGWFLGYFAMHYQGAPIPTVVAVPPSKRVADERAELDRCMTELADARQSLASCIADNQKRRAVYGDPPTP